jgi:uncharacterized RDD family membrane protein YckC
MLTACMLAGSLTLAAPTLVEAGTQDLIEVFEHGGWGPTIVRVGQELTLKQGEAVGDVIVVYSPATIEGVVRGNVLVVFGTVKIGKTAVIDNSLLVFGGNVDIEPGAIVRRDLFVFGGEVRGARDFRAGHEHITIGAPWIADQVRGVVPWITEGLLLGRPIVPRLDWVWIVVAITFLMSLVLCLMFLDTVRTCADTIAARPLTTFLVGLLVLLLTGPVAVVLAASVIGIAVLPFMFCALIIAWIVGKIGVKVRIGDSIVGQPLPASRSQAVRSFVLGSGIVYLAYILPVLGLVVWALIGVTGLGAASLAFISAYRRENRFRRTPVVPASPAPATPAVVAPAPAVAEEMPPPPPLAVESPADIPLPPPPVAEPTYANPLLAFPRAGILERAGAILLDVALVVFAMNMLDFDRHGNRLLFFLIVYHVVLWAWKGTTLGGIVCQLRIVRVDGVPLRFIDALVRSLATFFSVVPVGIGFLWILKDPQRQSWHDKIAGTYVVTVPRSWPL